MRTFFLWLVGGGGITLQGDELRTERDSLGQEWLVFIVKGKETGRYRTLYLKGWDKSLDREDFAE